MKKWIALCLCAAMLLSMLPGTGFADEPEPAAEAVTEVTKETAAETVAEATADPTEEPTEATEETVPGPGIEPTTVSIDTNPQTFLYDGEGKAFVLKDTDGNLLPCAQGSSAASAWLVPCVYGEITRTFGNQSESEPGSTFHQGVDLAAPKGTPVYAARAGIVTVAGYGSAAGNYVQINHSDGYASLYMHMNSYVVKAGEKACAGQLIGYVGQTGTASESHLHFGISCNGEYVDPLSCVNFADQSKRDTFFIDYSAPEENLNGEGLPFEPGTYSIRITRPETDSCKAVDLTIENAVVIEEPTPVEGDCGGNLTWHYDKETGELTISGSDGMYSYTPENPAPWSAFSGKIRKISLPDNDYFYVGSYAFANCTAITSVTLPGERVHLGEGAFSGCTNLKEITFKGSISYPIEPDVFSGVTATVYYPAGYGWSAQDRSAFGKNLTWVAYGKDAAMLSVFVPTIRVGETGEGTVTAHPFDAIADCTFAVSDPKILKIVSYDGTTVTVKGLKAGTTTLTATDKKTGLSASQEVCVYGTKKITCPYEEEILIDSESVIKEYSFTPEKSGEYVLVTTDVNSPSFDGCGFSVNLDGEYMGALSYQWDGGIIQNVLHFEAGKTYCIQVCCFNAEKGRTAKFRLMEAGKDIASVVIRPEIMERDSGTSGWIEVVTEPYSAYGKITWTSSNPKVAEITYTDGGGCSFEAKQPGEAVITAACGDKSDSVKVIVSDTLTLQLNQTVKLKSYAGSQYSERIVQFTPEEFGRYVFTVTGKNLRTYDVNFGRYSTSYPVNYSYSADSISLLRYLDAGETCSVNINMYAEDGDETITVRKATDSVRDMKLVCLYNTPTRVEIGAQFTPETAAEEVIKWEISDPKLLGKSQGGSPCNNYVGYTPYGAGEVTITATSESGFVASCTISVGQCLQGHDYTEWETIVDSTGVPMGEEHRFCTRCDWVEKRKEVPDTPVYRLYNQYTNEHLLVSEESEKDGLLAVGWTLDGVAWKAPNEGTPVYRLYNPYDDFHFYTMSMEEVESLLPLGWTMDGPVSCSAGEEGRPVYRLFNPYEQTNYHMFTASEEERDYLASLGWIPEGVAWYSAE